MPKIAFLGTGPEAAYHPLAPLEAELTNIFAPLGKRFTGHLEAAILAFRPLGPLEGLAGIEPWEMHDEPYRFEFDPLVPLSPLF